MFESRYIKTKALFQIFLIIFVVFSVSLIESRDVVAQEQNVCCSETISGEHCVYTGVSNCAPNAQKAAATCEQTSFCKLGCGFDQTEGICFNNMPKFSCEAEEGCQWSPDSQCNIPQCSKGCCVLSNECSFTTQVQCKQVTSQFEDINMTFMEEITSEIACINQCRSFERGACVHPDASCEFTTRENCNEDNPELNNVTLPLVGFHPDTLCSNPKLGTECAQQHHTGCLTEEDEVYWFDSCGNPENIYSSDKSSSYNGGFILSKAESCSFGNANINSASCGNCNYAKGSLCDVAVQGVNPVFGDYACKSLMCDNTVVIQDVNSPASLNLPLDNGESWCAYDGLVGFSEKAGLGLDLVGSRHYRRICINGEELTEPCKDFREEICVQGDVDPNVDPVAQQIYGTQESFELGGDDTIIAGACRVNRANECSSLYDKEACENVAQRDCLWLLGDQKKGDKSTGVACVPLVSPGFKHWSGKSTTKTSKLDPKATCELGSTECEVFFHKGGFGGDWECVGNCQCLGVNYLQQANAICKSLGDCGAWYNIAGEKTCSGLVENLDAHIKGVSGDPDVCDVLPPFGNLQGFSGGEGLDSGFGEFLSQALQGPVPLLLASSLLLSYTSTTYIMSWGTTLFKAPGLFFKSLAPGGSTPLGVLSRASTHLTGLSEFLYYFNIVMWIYLAYQFIDIVFADDMSEVITVDCQVWQAPVGGDDCELCQENGKACSEYRCKSLGQSCELINVGTEEEKCISGNVNDVVPPFIQVNKNLIVQLTDSIDNVNQIAEVPGKGFEITKKVAPFTAVSLSINTNEYAQCKFDINHGVAYDEMIQYFGSSLYELNHTILFSLPGALAEEEILKLTNGGEYQIYVKCQDGNGNQNEADYYAKFKIDDGPDFTPPVIEATSIANGAYVPSGINKTEFTIYVNEPSTCKWDDVDVAFNDMFNSFSCSTSIFPTTSLYYGLFPCNTELTGIQDAKKNNYYFRCKDLKDNINSESFFFNLQGTNPLVINSVDPDDNEQLKFNSPVLKVVTTGGAFGNGNSYCGYNFDDPNPFNSIEFLNTNSSVHEQPFFNLTSGAYDIYVTCIDIAGNVANETSEFDIIIDSFPPQLMQIYTTPGILNLVTDEPTSCEYSVDSSFSYGNGIPMTGVNTELHTASLEGEIYHVMCADNFGNVGSYILYL